MNEVFGNQCRNHWGFREAPFAFAIRSRQGKPKPSQIYLYDKRCHKVEYMLPELKPCGQFCEFSCECDHWWQSQPAAGPCPPQLSSLGPTLPGSCRSPAPEGPWHPAGINLERYMTHDVWERLLGPAAGQADVRCPYLGKGTEPQRWGCLSWS